MYIYIYIYIYIYSRSFLQFVISRLVMYGIVIVDAIIVGMILVKCVFIINTKKCENLL